MSGRYARNITSDVSSKMNDVFGNPKSLIEAVNSVLHQDVPLCMMAGLSRHLDIRPLYLIGGFDISDQLNEVYTADSKDYIGDVPNAEEIHKRLTVANVPKSIQHYTGIGSRTINSAMWNNYLRDEPISQENLNHIDSISRALIKMTPVNGAKLYTGVPRSPAALAGLEWNSTRPHKLIHFPSFTSTTTNFGQAIKFSPKDYESVHHESDHHGIILPGARHVIELNFDHNIQNALSLRNHSCTTTEQEILLGPHYEFELDPRPTFIDHHQGPQYIWKARPSAYGVNDFDKFNDVK